MIKCVYFKMVHTFNDKITVGPLSALNQAGEEKVVY